MPYIAKIPVIITLYFLSSVRMCVIAYVYVKQIGLTLPFLIQINSTLNEPHVFLNISDKQV